MFPNVMSKLKVVHSLAYFRTSSYKCICFAFKVFIKKDFSFKFSKLFVDFDEKGWVYLDNKERI